MRLRDCLLLVVLLSASLSFAQSIDEEPSVQFAEGSGNGSVDDEDIEGSSLPPDSQYASSPVVHPKLTTPSIVNEEARSEETRATTTLVRQHKITTYATSTPRISTRPPTEPSEGGLFQTHGVLIGLCLIFIAILIIIVIVICCCKKKQGYTPAKSEEP